MKSCPIWILLFAGFLFLAQPVFIGGCASSPKVVKAVDDTRRTYYGDFTTAGKIYKASINVETQSGRDEHIVVVQPPAGSGYIGTSGRTFKGLNTWRLISCDGEIRDNGRETGYNYMVRDTPTDPWRFVPCPADAGRENAFTPEKMKSLQTLLDLALAKCQSEQYLYLMSRWDGVSQRWVDVYNRQKQKAGR